MTERDERNQQSPDLEALQIRLAEMATLVSQLERECERLRRECATGEDARKLKAENAHLETTIAEMERQHGEAVQSHSSAVAGYMVELNQRAEALHAREIELQRTREELALTKEACEDAVAQLATARQERGQLERQLMELRAVAGGTRKAAEPAAKVTTAPRAPVAPPRSEPQLLRSKPPKPATHASRNVGPLTLIHLEESSVFREPIRQVLAQLPGSRYLNTLEADRSRGPGTRMLAVNLLNRTDDPLAAIASSVVEDADHQHIFAYCADGPFGFAFGTADFFSQPVDPNECVARLLESRGAIHRLLAVSENIEMTGTLREVLRGMHCSTSVALDMRQMVDLLPMIDPDMVLLDLALPRGDGLRLISRLRSDAKTRLLPLAVLLPASSHVAEFRQYAIRAARESPFSADELAQALRQRLGGQLTEDADANAGGLLQAG